MVLYNMIVYHTKVLTMIIAHRTEHFLRFFLSSPYKKCLLPGHKKLRKNTPLFLYGEEKKKNSGKMLVLTYSYYYYYYYYY